MANRAEPLALTQGRREKARLEALKRLTVLDTPPERCFDDITKIAAEVFSVPVALLTLVDENRVWVKSCFGIQLQEIPHEAAFCTKTIEGKECLIVPDATLDERFKSLPWITREDGFRFYAGAAIHTIDGQAVGALCILDREVRPALSLVQQEHLKALASLAADELELRFLRYREEARRKSPALANAATDPIQQNALTIQMREATLHNLHMEAELRYAIEHQHLVLHYQPEVDLHSKEVVGFEALIRWAHPQKGLIPPSDFIPLAEDSGLILPLGEWGLKEACRQIQEWRSLSKEEVELRVSVNLSARQFSSPDLPKQVSGVLKETGLSGLDLRLEVTESCLMPNAERALEMLTELRDLGIGLQMDDFGTGYSSLNYLHRYPFDTLKIDRSFVKDICSSKHSWQIVRSIVELARSLKLNVVAEGIETENQLKTLKKLGCRFGQGYLFAKPLTASTITSLLQMPSSAESRFYFQNGMQ